ncbi:XRE family transcriptional regulator, partial [Pseudomonas sp. MWU13-2625]
EPRASRRGPAPRRAERDRDAGAAGKDKKAAAKPRVSAGKRPAAAQPARKKKSKRLA